MIHLKRKRNNTNLKKQKNTEISEVLYLIKRKGRNDFFLFFIDMLS